MLIGVSGKKQSGKDMFFRIAVETFPNKVVKRLAFADAVKRYASEFFGVSPDVDKETSRWVLQGIGEMFREKVDKSYWINQVSEKIDNIDTIYIVTDVRYRNEASWIEQAGGVLVRVERRARWSLVKDAHPSETELDDYAFGHVIDNNGSLKEYREAVTDYLLSVLAPEERLPIKLATPIVRHDMSADPAFEEEYHNITSQLMDESNKYDLHLYLNDVSMFPTAVSLSMSKRVNIEYHAHLSRFPGYEYIYGFLKSGYWRVDLTDV